MKYYNRKHKKEIDNIVKKHVIANDKDIEDFTDYQLELLNDELNHVDEAWHCEFDSIQDAKRKGEL